MPGLPKVVRSRAAKPTKEQNFEADSRLEKDSTFDKPKEDDVQAAPWKALFFFTTKSHLTCLAIALAAALAAGGITPAQSYLLGKAFNAFTNSSSPGAVLNSVSKYATYIAAVGVGSWLVHFVFFTAWLAFGELQANSARERLFLGMLDKEVEWYDMRKNGIGAMIPRLQAQIRDLQLATAQPFGGLISSTADAMACLGLALYTSWKLTLVIVSTAPIITLIVGYLGASMQQYVIKQQEKLTEALKYVGNAINAIETVKCFNGQEHELAKYSARLKEAASWYYRVINVNAQQFGFMGFMTLAMFVQGFYYGGVQVDNGEKNTGDVITTFFSAMSAFQAIASILPQMIVLEKGRTAGSTLRAVMAQMEKKSGGPPSHELLKPDKCEGYIEFRNVSFAYPARPDRMAFKDVSLSIPAHATTFIIGKSGSGKSTFGQLLLQFYPAAAGQILFDGLPIDSLDPVWLRSHVTLVEQHSMLFEDTVFQNIAIGTKNRDAVNKQDVNSAAEFALLLAMVNDMPDGFQTMVGAKGGTMSGGQRQRMALARAYLRDTPVLLLDESTSALDQVSRSLMMEAIRRWRGGKTTMIITHDISQILAEDYAMIFEDGKLVQEGYRKDMEQTQDSPFHKFLSSDSSVAPESDVVARHHSLEVVERDAYADSRHQEHIDDPLEAHLSAGENPRYSYLPTLFANRHTKAAFRRAYGFPASPSEFGSPTSPVPPGPTSPTNRVTNLKDCTVLHGSQSSDTVPQIHKEPTLDKKPINRRSIAPELLERFVESTGNLAARARLTSGKPRRRRIPSAGSIPTVSGGTEMQPFSKQKKHDAPTLERQVFSIRAILGTVWPSLDWYMKAVLIVAFVAASINGACTPVFSNILSKLIGTYGKGGKEKHTAVIYTVSILGIAAINGLTSYVMHLLLEYVGQVWINTMRERSLERILDQPRDWFTYEENSVSHVMEGLDRHAEETRNLLGRFASSLYIAFVLSVVALVWALTSQWKLTLIAIALGPYVWFVTKSFSTVSGNWEGKSNDAAEAAGSIFTETFTNIKTVRALTLETHFRQKYFCATKSALQIGFRRSLYAGFFYGLSDSSGVFVMALMLYAGAKLINDGADVAKIVEVFVQLILAITNVSIYLSLIPQISLAKDCASRLLRLSTLPKDSHEHFGNTQITSIGDIELHKLSFAYPSRPEQMVLNDINLLIPAGETTAIVGSSGSGKSTIASLLLNLYTSANEASEANGKIPDIMLSGRDLKHIHTPTLRSLITVVSQTPVLFSATVAENISYGLPPSSPYTDLASVRRAAAAAGIDEFIMSLSQGYETLIGEGGTGLSGGQAQRVAIARALVRRPAVMILDEATSALDVESSNLVRDTIQGLVERDGSGMTVIIITHSKDMMRIAKNIIMLSEGQVVEYGSYERLLLAKGEFFHLLSGGEWAEEPERRDSTGVRGLSGRMDWGKSKVRA
ncbi:putative ABC transporter [Aureobasidium pullulans]|uniref:ABC transporter n=1 Tax=Aureobasidium pullulans TaxID=5580 RepID=A0A4S9BFS8_AURPU|nr:putative ABC transporter [Aureobasidium pullulans]THW91396.1 putative ABC transporter [Aureobasidium pullulans]